MSDPIKVQEGTKVQTPEGEMEVHASCGGSRGAWYCVTHRESFANQFYKDTHIGKRGQHVLAWICPVHGLEVP